jgi:hypothetical protein
MKRQIEIENSQNGTLYYEVNFAFVSVRLLTNEEYHKINNIIANELLKMTQGE